MKLHELKIKREYYEAILFGKKTFELRKNDRDYQAGDLIHFVNLDGTIYIEETCEEKNVYQITYILKDVPEYGLDKNYCILGIKKLEAKDV